MLYNKDWDKKDDTKLEPWQQILQGAITYLETYGWCQKEMFQHSPDVMNTPPAACMIGALSRINPNAYLDNCKAYMAVQDTIGGHRMIAYWNDTPGRTKEEVIAVLRKAMTSKG